MILTTLGAQQIGIAGGVQRGALDVPAVSSYVYPLTPAAIPAKLIQLGYLSWSGSYPGSIRGVLDMGCIAFGLPATRGLFTVTGRAATPGAGRRLALTAGTLVLTGRAASLVGINPLEAACGAFALTGNAAACLTARNMAAAAASFALTGPPATMLVVVPSLLAARGAFAQTGHSAAMTRGRILHAAVGGVGLNAPGLSFGTFINRGRDTQLFHQAADGTYFIPAGAFGEYIMAVQVDIIEGSSASHHITQGWAITRVAVITGLNPAATDDTAKLYNDALAALIAVVGDRGSQCPNISVPTYLEEFIPELLSAESVKIRMVYKGYPLPTYEFDGSLSQVESNLDANGQVITTQYTYPDNYALDPRKAGLTVTQGGMVSRPVPEPCFTIRFIVTDGTIPPLTIGTPPNPGSMILVYSGTRTATEIMTYLGMYEGTVNNAYYQIGLINGAPHQWMITKVRGTSRDAGNTYEAAITFQFRAATWDQQTTFINPDDGKPPPDLVANVGYKLTRVPPETSFPIFTFGPN